jgi:hypothetical protein
MSETPIINEAESAVVAAAEAWYGDGSDAGDALIEAIERLHDLRRQVRAAHGQHSLDVTGAVIRIPEAT